MAELTVWIYGITKRANLNLKIEVAQGLKHFLGLQRQLQRNTHDI